ncbi:MAG: hypothetical protein U9Q40_01430 [Campylobacterota bacterium]|nr:hypothetical protein [Campylobacterota bacterium]
MSIFGQIAGKVFGTDKAVDNLLDKDKGILVRAGGWINDMSYTDAEKAENALLVKEWGIKQLEALEPFKIMQRIMVTIIMFQWAVLFNVIVVAICLKADSVLADLIEFAQSQYAWYPMGAAVTLYLLGGVWKGGAKK